MKFFKNLAILSALTILGFSANAQTDSRTDNHNITIVVPDVALLDLEATSKNFTSTLTQATEAGDKVTMPASNTDLWLNYSSIVPTTIVTARRVSVKASALVPGLDISVLAGTSSTGFGTKGTPTTAVTLTLVDQPLINGIGSAYTVSGVSKGHQLTYAFTALDANYGNLRAGSTVVTVTYTLVDY